MTTLNPVRPPSLSVGIPVYNQADTIGDTIRSLLNQSSVPIEIVVSENHSTDGVDGILAQFKGRIRVIKPSSHLGMMANWNFLAAQLKGDWFTLLSADDLARPNFVEALREAAGAVDNAVLVRGDYVDINGNGEIVADRSLLSVGRVVLPPRTWIEQIGGPKASFAAFAMRHTAWVVAGGFPEEFKLFGDWAMWLKLSKLGAFVHAQVKISEYRVTERPSLERSRVPLRISDEHQMICRLLPSFLDPKDARLKRVAKKRFLALLDYIYINDAFNLSSESCVQLNAIAKIANREDFLNQWRSCPARVALPFLDRFRKCISTLVRNIVVFSR